MSSFNNMKTINLCVFLFNNCVFLFNNYTFDCNIEFNFKNFRYFLENNRDK